VPPGLEGALARVRDVLGPAPRALVLSGSHACGEGVWADLGGVRVALSDLDLFAVLGDRRACRDTAARWDARRPGRDVWLAEHGLAAPPEVAFLTPRDLARQPARPGTIELARHGRVFAGDAAVLRHVPRWSAADVDAEETTLLLENRAFELLGARLALPDGDALARLRARHAVLKVALDLAGVAALAEGYWPDGAAARVEWARGRGVAGTLRAGVPVGLAPRGPEPALEAVWDAAVAWRRGRVAAPEPAAAAAEWAAVARAWCAAWLARHGGGEPAACVARAAARARLRRRLRLALFPAGRVATRGGWPARWRHVLAGTPQHRAGAAAAALLLEASASAPAHPGLRAALARLGVPGGAAGDWRERARAALRAWDLWVLDGARLAEDP
jgi:hypothetical protein